MEDDHDDELLLSSLGVASANPQAIERKILSQTKNDVNEPGESSHNYERGDEAAVSSTQNKLYNKLHALEVEIDAVASSIDRAKYVTDDGNDSYDNTGVERHKAESSVDNIQAYSNGLSLEQALATDRLRSLKKAKAQLQNEISLLDDHVEEKETEKLLQVLVKENPQKGKRLKSTGNTIKPSKRPMKAVSYDEDVEFDAMLDASSSGFMETERDKLVRKGIFTPFHKLKGFERRVQLPENSSKQGTSLEDLDENLAKASIAKLAQSMSQIASARPTTKLLDAEDLPALERPTHPFQRLKAPIKLLGSLTESENNKRKPKRIKRPKPDKRWSKEDVKNDNSWNGSGML